MFCDVIMDVPTYIVWCAENIPEFRINPDVIKQIIEFDKSIILPIQIRNSIGLPIKFHLIYEESNNQDENDYCDESYRDNPTYERYNGSYAQDEMGYSDDDIDTIFDGDPSAYWNID